MGDGWLEGWVDCTGTASYLILDAQPKGVTDHMGADVSEVTNLIPSYATCTFVLQERWREMKLNEIDGQQRLIRTATNINTP